MNLSRRDFIRFGSLASLSAGSALGMPYGALAHDQLNPNRQPLKNCILIWLDGGPSHIDTFDPKPNASEEVRGPFSTISTKQTDIQLSELLPRLAEQINDWAILRSVTSPLGEHNFGTHYLLTGYKPSTALEYPSLGSIVSHRLNQHDDSSSTNSKSALPSNIAVPHFRVGGAGFSGNGFLPSTTRPFSLDSDPAKGDFAVRDLQPTFQIDANRLSRRERFLDQLESFRRNSDLDNSSSALPATYHDAFRMIRSPDAVEAFDLGKETDQTRNRYGRRTVGQSCLLARRLVQRGVSFVTVNNTGWDTHNDAYTRLKEGFTGAKQPVGLVPSLDQAITALIDDLKTDGLLESTLVIVMGEFGRTPKLNPAGGRDHWPRVFSVLMAGGGVTGGQVIGASDRHGESPADKPITPSDISYSALKLLGLDPHHELTTDDGRPIQLNRDGKWIDGLG